WVSVRFWLRDLAQEIAASIEEPATAPVFALERVWLSRSGQAIILEFPCSGILSSTHAGFPIDVIGVQSFLEEIARQMLGPSPPAPPAAQSFLTVLKRRGFGKLEFIIGNVSHLISKAPEVTRAWRAASLTFLPACFALLGIFTGGVMTFE